MQVYGYRNLIQWLIKRLPAVDAETLCELKRELRRFDMKRKAWKKEAVDNGSVT